MRARLGVLSDARGLYPRLTARENIVYHGRLHGVPDEVAQARCEHLGRLLEMESLLDRRTDGFSQGERMKTALARALVHDPDNIVLDEPTNGLDVVATRALREALRVLRDETGKCIVFSTHIMQEVERLCDRVVVVARGRHVADGTVAEPVRAGRQRGLRGGLRAPGVRARQGGRNEAAAIGGWIVFAKELKDALRDRRTLMAVFVSSVLMGPLMLVMLSTLVGKYEKRAEAREVVVIGLENAPALRNYIERQTFVVKTAPADWETQLKESKLGDPVVIVPAGFEDDLAHGRPPRIELVYSSANARAQSGVGPIAQLLQGFDQEQASLRLIARGVAPGRTRRHAASTSTTSPTTPRAPRR